MFPEKLLSDNISKCFFSFKEGPLPITIDDFGIERKSFSRGLSIARPNVGVQSEMPPW